MLFEETQEHKDLNKKRDQERVDKIRQFHDVFSTPSGKAVLEHLEAYSIKGYPNYGVKEGTDGISAIISTYSKIGEQTMVRYIKTILAQEIKIK